MLEELGTYLFETFGSSSPRIFIIICIVIGMFIGAFAGGYFGWKINKGFQDSLGDIEGQLIFEDGVIVPVMEVQIFKNNKFLKKVTVNSGEFYIQIKHGFYSLLIKREGYIEEKVENIQSSSGLNKVQPIVIRVKPKSISISISDNSGVPYKDVRLALVKNSEAKETFYLNFNHLGQAMTPLLSSGEYHLYLADPLTINNNFLWSVYPGGSLGKITLQGDRNTYSLKLPRVLVTNMGTTASASGTPNFSDKNYFAQSFTLATKMSFCGVGFGAFTNPSPIPSRFEVRKDMSNKPADKTLYSTENTYRTAAVTHGYEAPFANFCPNGSTQITLDPGKYWILAFSSDKKDTVHFFGTTLPSNSSQEKMLFSKDGLDWEAFNVGMRELTFFITE